MFSTPTTIILGAGASYEFGAPLGADLWTRIARDTTNIHETFEEERRGSLARSPVVIISPTEIPPNAKDPKAVAYLEETKALLSDDAVLDAIFQASGASSRVNNNPLAVMKHVAQRISDANVQSSVDDFLRDHPSLVPMLRVLIAAEIFEGLYQKAEHTPGHWSLRQRIFKQRFALPHHNKNNLQVDNWIIRFVGACRPLLLSAGTSVTPVTVISFNYDRILETVLARFWSLSERKYPPLHECFKFIYPYGCFSEFPETVSDPASWVREQSKGIGLADGGASREINAVRAAISSARQVFAVGFSFTETNIALLGLKPKHADKLFVQNYENRDTRLKRLLEQRFAGARADDASLARLVSDGFFEQRGPESGGIKTAKVSFG